MDTREYFYAFAELISTPAEKVKTARVLCAPEKKKKIIINTRYKSLRNGNLSLDSKTAYPFSRGIKRIIIFIFFPPRRFYRVAGNLHYKIVSVNNNISISPRTRARRIASGDLAPFIPNNNYNKFSTKTITNNKSLPKPIRTYFAGT